MKLKQILIMNKNAVYILKQPEHVILSIIMVGKDYPKTETEQQMIDKLSEVSDIFFIFSNKIGNHKINMRKFTSLNRGCGFIYGTKTIGETLFDVLEYSKHIFQKHIGYLLLNDWNIAEIENRAKLPKFLVNWTASTLVKPILKIRRLEPDELYEFYKEEESSGWKFWKSIEEETDKCMFLTHTSSSPYIYFKNLVVEKWLEKDRDNYLRTFETNDIRDIVASLIKDLGMEYLEVVNLGDV